MISEKVKEELKVFVFFLSLITILSFFVFLFEKTGKNAWVDEKCYKESAEIWNSVQDFPYIINDQEAFDKHNRQACAAFKYIACINGENIECAPVQEDLVGEEI